MIAKELGRSPSTISRERKRNATRHDGGYRAEKAETYARTRRRQSKTEKLDKAQWQVIDELLRAKWSPEQVAERLGAEEKIAVGRETIYKRVRRDKAAGGTLWKHLRIMTKHGRKKRGSPVTRNPPKLRIRPYMSKRDEV